MNSSLRIKQNNSMLTTAADVDSLCWPLRRLGITHFSHARQYRDFSLTVLCNNAAFTDFCFSQSVEAGVSINPHEYRFWSDFMSLDFLHVIDNFNISQCFEICCESKDYFDIYAFGTSTRSYAFKIFCLSNIDLFKSFILHYNDSSKQLFHLCDLQRLKNPLFDDVGTFQNLTLEQDSFAFSCAEKRNFLANVSCKSTSEILTQREIECLYQIGYGRTAKETGRILNISNRTVEAHIASTKEKLNCHTKSQLISYFWSSKLAPLNKH